MKHHIFICHVTWSEVQTHHYLLQLNQAEQQQAQQYLHPLRLKAFVASRLLLKKALNYVEKTHQDWLFTKTNGRLIINHANNNWSISLSHTNDWVACLLSPQQYCGIDIEQRLSTHRFMAIARRFYDEQEFLYLQQLPEAEALATFLDWWTRKEACIKAWHVGIAHYLNRIIFNSSQLSPIDYPPEFKETPLEVHTISHENLQIACAVHDTQAEWQLETLFL